LEVEPDVLGGVLRVGEQHHTIVEDDHTPIVGGHDLLEVVVAEVVPPEGFGELGIVEVDLTDAVAAARNLQPIWSQLSDKVVRFEDSLERSQARMASLLSDIGLETPKEVTA
jgi:hypothetical protein